MMPADIMDQSEKTGYPAVMGSRLIKQKMIQCRMVFNEVTGIGCDHHGKITIGVLFTQGAENRCGQNDIPQAVGADDEDAFRLRIGGRWAHRFSRF